MPMMKSTIILLGLCFLCMMPDYSAGVCNDRHNEYRVGDNWLQGDCKRQYTCTATGIETGSVHWCPRHSHCDDSKFYGRCLCNKGYKATRFDDKGFAQECKKWVCNDRYNEYTVGDNWLQNDCKRQYTCTTSGIETGSAHSCPRHSHCDRSKYYGRCLCKKGYKATKIDDKGFVQECEKMVCKDKFNTYQLGDYWLQGDCKRIYTCTESGTKADLPHSCSKNAHCDNSNFYGECKCDHGYVPSWVDSLGFVRECSLGTCNDDVKEYTVGQKWLQADCKRQYKCTADGIKPGITYGCPYFSHCDKSNHYGLCKCDLGYAPTKVDEHGIIEECQRAACVANGREARVNLSPTV